MTRPVYIVAVSAYTAVGLTAESTAAAVRARISRVAEHPFMVDAAGDKLCCGRVAILDPELLGCERITALARPALTALAHKLTAYGAAYVPLPLFWALPEPRPGHDERDALTIARALTAATPGAPDWMVRLEGQGHAGALRALELAVQCVAQGQSELAVAGGVDSYLQADTLDWLDGQRRVARTGIRSGFPPGEGAAIVAVASETARRRLGLPALARICGVSSALEARRADSDEGLQGEALSTVVRAATAGLGPHDRADHIYCDINGERPRTDDWVFAVLRLPAIFRDATAYTTPIGQTGDLGAAAGALSCVLAVQAWQRGYAKGRHALVWGSSWGGLRSACLLAQEGG